MKVSSFSKSIKGSDIVEAFSKQIDDKTSEEAVFHDRQFNQIILFVITGPSAGGLGPKTPIELAAANLK